MNKQIDVPVQVNEIEELGYYLSILQMLIRLDLTYIFLTEGKCYSRYSFFS